MRLRAEADRLWKLGHVITGTWLHETKRPKSMPEDVFKRKLAIKDLCEISAAELLILDLNDKVTFGKAVETGFALGQFQHKQVWTVGKFTSPFLFLADIEFHNWDELIEYMVDYMEGANEVG